MHKSYDYHEFTECLGKALASHLAGREERTAMVMTRPEIRPPQLPTGMTAVGPQFPLSTGYYWIGLAETQLTEQKIGGIAIYNTEECHFLHAEDALSILYFLRLHEETLLQQTHISFGLPMLFPDEQRPDGG